MAKENPTLIMSATNPKGLTLELILECLINEVGAKTKKLDDALNNSDDETKLHVIKTAKDNNDGIVERLKSALELQLSTQSEFSKLGPDQGPKGKSRI